MGGEQKDGEEGEEERGGVGGRTIAGERMISEYSRRRKSKNEE